MAITCVIEFDNNPHGTFFAGQVMTGKVTLKLDKQKLVKAVTLNINGFAETQWRENRGAGKSRSRDTFRGHEDYIASQTFLAGSKQSSKSENTCGKVLPNVIMFSAEVTLEPGIHVYTFACQIPVTCPSSIEGQFGRVRYMAKVSLLRPWKFDQSYTRCFTVLKLMDLNYDSPLLRVPSQSETQKSYCCWPCESEPLQLQLTLAQTGFVPGQAIPVGILVTNDSHIRVEEIQISLAMLVTYHATHMSRASSKSERFVVTKLIGDPVPNHCKKQFDYLLRVPATPPTCFNLCRIIQIAYRVEVEARVKGCHKNEVVNVPLTVGSVPLSEHLHMHPRLLAGEVNQALDVTELAYPAVIGSAPPADTETPWAVDATIQPPNYEEAVHMRTHPGDSTTDLVEDAAAAHTISLDGSAFSPLYPIFDIPSPSAPEDYAAQNNNTGTAKGTWL
ncbi:hypothetical protein KR222_005403 [Zaprionus bogoriensis]|nr:hypothetical protein KR222_005403 [Zaprionus bogoriensis]